MTLRCLRPFLRAAALLTVAALVAVACSGDDDDAAPVITTSTSTTSSSTSTTTVALGPVAPLTGAPTLAEFADNLQRPAMAVKIHNQDGAFPQAGLESTDLIYEELIASSATRLIAVYHSLDAPTVGPIRSARTSDPPILANLNTPGFAYSGANPGTLDAGAQRRSDRHHRHPAPDVPRSRPPAGARQPHEQYRGAVRAAG